MSKRIQLDELLERLNTYSRVESLLINDEQKFNWLYFNTRVAEYLQSKFKGRLVLDLQGGRINSIFDQAQISGTTQTLYYLNKID